MAKKYTSKYTGPEIDAGIDKVPVLEGKLTELESEGTDFSRGIYASVNSWISGISLGGFSSGVKNNNTTRARFNGYITAPFRIETNEGYIVRQITRFEKLNDGTLSYVSQMADSSNEFFVESKSKYLYTIAFSKSDDTQDLNTTDLPLIVKTFKGWGMYIEENITNLNKNVENGLAELNTAIDKYDGNIINNITLERGSLLGGVPNEDDKRCRNIGYIESPFNVTLSLEYRITSIYRYNKSLEYIDSEVIKKNFVEVAEDEYLYRFAISKVDDTQVIEIEEISAIVESYNNKSTLIDKGLTDSTKQIERLLTQTKDVSSLEKREKGIFVGKHSVNPV